MSRRSDFIKVNQQVMEGIRANMSRDAIIGKNKLSLGQFKRHLAEIALVAPEILVKWKPTTASVSFAEMPVAFQSLLPQHSKASANGIIVKFELDGNGDSGFFEIVAAEAQADVVVTNNA
ncbi:MAG: hypothetical protein IJU65_09470 [Desulfovibrio sp.]|nr:hypothetical protein [Desulfovibrio sp.]